MIRDLHRLDFDDPNVDEFDLEREIGREVESKDAPVLKEVRNAPHKWESYRKELVAFTQFTFFRVPKYRDSLIPFIDESVAGFVRGLERQGKFPPMPEEVKRELAGRHLSEALGIKARNWFLMDLMFRSARDPRLFALLCGMNAALLVAKAGGRFIVGDAAVVLYEETYALNTAAGGFASPTIEITVPLSSHLLFRLSRRHPAGIFEIEVSKVRDFNRRAILWADRFLFSVSFENETRASVEALRERKAGFTTDGLHAPDCSYVISRTIPVHDELLKL